MTRARRFLGLVGLVFLAACGSSPSNAIEEFYSLVENGEATRAAEMMTGPGVAMVGTEKMTAMLAGAATEIQARGGIDRVEVLQETVTGETALVDVRIHYGDGSTDDQSDQLQKVDGDWKILSAD